MRATLSWVLMLGVLAFVASPVAAETLEVRLLSLTPSSVSRGDIVTIVIQTTPQAECGGSITASGSGIEVGAGVTLPSATAFSGRAGWRFETAPVPAYYTITISCSLGDQKGQLITRFSAS